MIEEDFEPSMPNLQQNHFHNQQNLIESVISAEDVHPDVCANDDTRIPSEHQKIKMAVVIKILTGEKLTYTEQSMALAAVIVSSGGLIFGYELGAMAGSLAQLKQHFSMNADQEGMSVAILYLGQLIGGGLAGVLTDSIGRWRTCQIQTFIFAVGSLVLGTSHSLAPVLVGRFLIGVAAAFASISAVPYLREIAPHRYGGRFASTYEVFVVAGILLANVISVFVYDKQGSWRHIFLLPIAFAAVQAVAMWYIPESPSWLIQKGLTDRATAALRKIYNDPEIVVDELRALKLANLTKSHGRFSTVRDVLRQYRHLLLLVILVSVMNALCGTSVFVAYLPLVFETHTGITSHRALILNVLVGVVRVVATLGSISLLDSPRGGRRLLLLVGVAMICVGQLLLAVSFLRSEHIADMYAVGTCVSVAGQSVGFGVVTSLLQTEMFPTLVRARAMSVALAIQSLALYGVNVSFPHLMRRWGAETLFFLYAACGVLAFILLFALVPETKGKRPAEILASVSHPENPTRQTETGTSMEKGQAVSFRRNPAQKGGVTLPIDGEVENPLRPGPAGPRTGSGLGLGQSPPVVTLYPAPTYFPSRTETHDSDF